MLAALLLKLGTYGLIRFGVAVFSYGTAGFFVFAAMLGLLSITYTGMTAMCQIDLKKVIAYSSIGHMNVVVLGIISGYMEGMLGAIFTKISHGIISGALFFSIGVIYTRHAVRSLKLYGGLTFVMPFLSAMTLIFTLGNIGFPLTSGYVGEFTTLFGIFLAGFLLTLLASTGMVLGAAYML
jgi:NADH-quinone oxidoreductase subunit M